MSAAWVWNRAPSGVALIFVDEKGQNSIIVVPGANNALTPKHVSDAGHHFASAKIVLLQLENPIPTVLAAAQAARKAGARVILDPAPAPSTPLPSELFKSVDILTPNETEAAILAGMPPGNLEPAQAVSIGGKLLSMGAKDCDYEARKPGLRDRGATAVPFSSRRRR